MKAPDLEPLLPSTPDTDLQDLAVELVVKADRLAGALAPNGREGIVNLVRSMNCYYSNLIEGHDTLPRDIERALAEDYSADPQKRALQLEAGAHIAVQRQIDDQGDPRIAPTDKEHIVWLHKAFCSKLPDELLSITDPDTAERKVVTPGAFRDRGVQVGRHIPPASDRIDPCLARFEQAYAPARLNRVDRIIAVAAAHHRLLWIHPFHDGNGRVARLMSHAMLVRAELGSSLWPVSRGLARSAAEYKAGLQQADSPRQGDLDGRGARSEKALVAFCRFFLSTCIDQIDFMESLIKPAELLRRMKLYVDDETAAGRLPPRAMVFLQEAFYRGEVERGRAAELTGYQERPARQILSALLDKGLLVSQGPRAPVRLGFPLDVVERWFTNLYPVG